MGPATQLPIFQESLLVQKPKACSCSLYTNIGVSNSLIPNPILVGSYISIQVWHHFTWSCLVTPNQEPKQHYPWLGGNDMYIGSLEARLQSSNKEPMYGLVCPPPLPVGVADLATSTTHKSTSGSWSALPITMQLLVILAPLSLYNAPLGCARKGTQHE